MHPKQTMMLQPRMITLHLSQVLRMTITLRSLLQPHPLQPKSCQYLQYLQFVQRLRSVIYP